MSNKKKPSARQKRRTFQCIRKWSQDKRWKREVLRWFKKYRFWLLALLPIMLCFTFPWIVKTACWVVYGGSYGDAGAFEIAGQSGDMYGSLNALFSALALAGVLLALWMQRQDLNLQRAEMKKQTQQFESQVEIAAIQTLFTSLPLYKQRMNREWQRVQDERQVHADNEWR